MAADAELLRLIALIDQDRADGERWWRQSTLAEKMAVWDAIQREYDDPAIELMSRFAQLGFAEMCGRMVAEEGGGK